MRKILVVEDEININELIKYNLQGSGYEVISALDGITGTRMVYTEKPDLIILDLMLPQKDGYAICRELREANINTPIIMLTAKGEEQDKIKGLDMGADDYIVKPFGIRELLSRVNANMRRCYGMEPKLNKNIQQGENDEIPAVLIDKEAHIVTVGGIKIELTFKEYELLVFLFENKGKVYSRNELLDVVWGIDYMGETRTVDVHIRYIRRKLDIFGRDIEYIETIRGRGYKWKLN